MSETLRTSDQGQVLADIRRALGRSETVRPMPLEPFIEAPVVTTSAELVARFTEEITAVVGHAHRARSSAEVATHIARICADASVRELALSGASMLAELNLPAQLAAQHLSAVVVADFDSRSRDELIAFLAGCGVGVTAVDYAIAETGTLVLTSDEEQSLLVSLLPAIHIAVVHQHQISSSLATVIEKLNHERMLRAAPCRTATFITGPSRTSDVELTLSIGVHGPKALHVIMLGEDSNDARLESTTPTSA